MAKADKDHESFLARMAGKDIFTTGQVARICQVSARTVSKWFDSGRLAGWRIPGSNDRRVPRDCLLGFLRESGMPLFLSADRELRVGLVTRSSALAAEARTNVVAAKVAVLAGSFALGLETATAGTFPDVLLLDGDLGRHEAASCVEAMRTSPRPPGARSRTAAALLSEDSVESDWEAVGCRLLLRRPLHGAEALRLTLETHAKSKGV